MRNSIYTKHAVYLFSIVPESQKEEITCVSVSDFLSERCRVEDIAYWLLTFSNGMSRVCGDLMMRPTTPPKIIVTDCSWAIIHAALLIFGHTSIDVYMDKMFRFLSHESGNRGPAILFLCSSHVISRLAKTVPAFDHAWQKRVFLSCFGALLTATSLTEAAEIWRLMVRIFCSPIHDKHVENALHAVSSETFQDRDVPTREESVNSFDSDDSIGKCSPFKAFFVQILEESTNSSSSTDGPTNPFYNTKAMELLCRQWLPLFGLWSAAALVGTGHHYLTNAKVESFFA